MVDLEFKIEDEGLWVEDRHSRYEDSIRPHTFFYSSFVANHAILRTLYSYEFTA